LALGFLGQKSIFIFVTLCFTRAYVHPISKKIGFVLHNWLFLIDPASPKGFAVASREKGKKAKGRNKNCVLFFHSVSKSAFAKASARQERRSP